MNIKELGMATKIGIFLCIFTVCATIAGFMTDGNEHGPHGKETPDFIFKGPYNNTVPYRWIQLKIESTNTTWVKHYDPPSITYTELSPVFEKSFLHQVLDLLHTISQLRYIFVGKYIGWNDVCYRGKGDNYCYMNSFLQYFDLSHSNLDRVLMDQFGFFILWDYWDHFQSCSNENMMGFDSKVNISCTDENDRPILPWDVLRGLDGLNFQNATALVVTMLFSTDRTYPDEVTQWQNEMTKLIHHYSNPNMTITFVRPMY